MFCARKICHVLVQLFFFRRKYSRTFIHAQNLLCLLFSSFPSPCSSSSQSRARLGSKRSLSRSRARSCVKILIDLSLSQGFKARLRLELGSFIYILKWAEPSLPKLDLARLVYRPIDHEMIKWSIDPNELVRLTVIESNGRSIIRSILMN